MCMAYVRFEGFMAVAMKSAIFWDVTRCGSYKNRRFRGMHCLHHQDGEKQWARNSCSNNWLLIRTAKKHNCIRDEAIEWDTREMGGGRWGGWALKWTFKQVAGVEWSGGIWGEHHALVWIYKLQHIVVSGVGNILGDMCSMTCKQKMRKISNILFPEPSTATRAKKL
jgi:hypothetical protein